MALYGLIALLIAMIVVLCFIIINIKHDINIVQYNTLRHNLGTIVNELRLKHYKNLDEVEQDLIEILHYS